jgi:PAS domain S-box-containing protein
MSSWFIKQSKKVPLRVVVVVPFLLEIFAAVGLTGWFSLQNGQKAVNEVAARLRNEVTARIQLQLQTFLAVPHLVNQINADAIHLDQLDIENFQQLERHFWQQIQLFDSVSYISLGTETGEFLGVERLENGRLRIVVTDETTQGAGYQYETDAVGNRTKLVTVNPNYDPRNRPWYRAAVKEKRAIWTEIYPVFAEQKLTISAAVPVYEQEQLQGVLITDLVLSQIESFLENLKISPLGQTYIVERSGLLVASSTSDRPFLFRNGQIERIKAEQSKNILIRATAQHLNQELNQLSKLGKNCQNPCHLSTSFRLKGQQQFVQVTPLQLIAQQPTNANSPLQTVNSKINNLPDWLIVVVVPEADFMEQIEQNTRSTILLCTLALFIAIVLGLFTSRWIVQPILQLNKAASALAQGDWNQVVPVEREDELGILARTFNQMTSQLRLLYADLEQNMLQLIQTQDSLRTSEVKYRELVQNANSMIVRLDTQGNITFFNEFSQRFFGYLESEILGQNVIGTIIPFTDSSGSDLAVMMQDILQNPEDYTCNENENIRRNGERVWVSWTLKALRDQNRVLTGILCIGSDISARKRAEDELAKRERYLAALVEVQRRLLAFTGTGNCYEEILEPLGQASGASRVYLFEKSWDENQQLQMSLKAQWYTAGMDYPVEILSLQTIKYDQWIPRWVNILNRGEPIAGTLTDFPPNERQLLAAQGISSLLILPLTVNGEFFGFLGFDNCQVATTWDELDINLLQAAAAAISLQQERLLAQQALQQAKENLEIRVEERTAQFKQSEARFRQLSAATFEGIVVHENGRIIDYNQSFLEMFGFQNQENLKSNILDYIAPHFRPLVAQNMNLNFENAYEAIALKSDGSTFPIEIEAKVIPYEGKQVRVVALRDITERIQAQEALRESENKFATAFRQSPNAITISSFPEGRLIDVSDGFLEITEYRREEVIGRTTLELNLWVDIEDRKRLMQMFQETVNVRNLEIKFRKRSGEILVGLLSAEVITLGGTSCILTVTSDITARKQAQEALARALKEQESIFEAQLDIIFVFDLNLNLIKWNQQMEIVTGLSPTVLKGRSALAFFPDTEREIVLQEIQKTFEREGGSSWLEVHVIGKNGALLDYQFTGVPLKDETGKVIGLTGTGRDITELKQANEILKIEQEKADRLLLNVLPKAIAERLKQQAGAIADSFEEVTVLFADIVGFTQLSAQISPTELVSLLNQVFSKFDQLAERHELEKIKTIGDAYMVVGGLPVQRHDHAEAIAEMALDMQQAVMEFSQETGQFLNIRIGINSGPVVAGVIGLKKFIYDLWGDTVNTASRMESQGLPGAIQVSEATYLRLQQKYNFQDRGVINVKGKGNMMTYLLMGRRNH